jgi:RNA polymerase sigma factor (sigma-70 family)
MDDARGLAELLLRVQASRHDQAVWDACVARLAPRLREQVHGMVSDGSLVDDIVQEALFYVFRHVGDFVPREDADRGAAGWLRLIARSCAIDAVRRRRRGARPPEEADLAKHSDIPSSTPVHRTQDGALERFLDDLEEVDRRLIDAVYRQGLDLAVAADRLGISEAAARKRHQRLIERLRRCMRDCDIPLSYLAFLLRSLGTSG